MTSIVIVAAIGENNVIGFRGGMPWHLRSDLAHFRALTINKPVIMGRKTFTSIGRPLPQRTNIIVTRDAAFSAPGIVPASSIDAALALALGDAKKRGIGEIMVIGGSDIFAAMMPMAKRLEITHVHASPEGDVHFPPIDPTVWREVSRKEHPAGPHDTASFAVAVYERR
ncbi:MAG TPA: dihydrofolate reductase [Pseudolabrys sp.]|nr:dihydrofolate reductase [Pseudolabrys sp.]